MLPAKSEAAPVVPLTYTVVQAANALTLSERSIYHLIKRGQLRKVKAGKRTLIPVASLNAYLAGEAA